MDIQYHGANCITINTKHARITIDDNLADIGGKTVTKEGDVVLFTSAHGNNKQKPKIVIDEPGEYEASGVSMYGIATRAHIDEASAKTAVSYKLLIDDVRIFVAGHIYPELTDRQLETIGMIDIMIVPVGGNGYTLDSIGALKLIKKIEPKVIIPTHYDAKGLTYAVPQQTLEDALKNLGMEPKEAVAKFKVKPAEMTDTAQLVVLEQV